MEPEKRSSPISTTTTPTATNEIPQKKIQLLRLRTFACEKLPKQDALHTKLPYVRGFQNLRDEKTYYLSYRCQELRDDVEGPRWNPDMMFHISPDASDKFELHVKDVNRIFRDECYGHIQFSIPELAAKCRAAEDGNYSVKGTFGKNGQFNYKASFCIEEWLDIYAIKPSQEQLVDLPSKFYEGIFGYLQKQIKITEIPKIRAPFFPKGKAETYTDLKDLDDPNGPPYIEILDEDEQVPIPLWAGPLIRFLNTFPFDKNTEHRFGGRANGKVALQNLVRGGLMPSPLEGPWEGDLTNDENTGRFFFINQGAPFVEKNMQTGLYEVDFGFIESQNFKMIDGHHPYCGKMFFNQDRLPVRILVKGVEFKPPSEGGDLRRWEWAKFLLRSTCFVVGSALHLVQIHQVWANYPNIALREHLDPNHPVRLLLSPFYYRSAMVARKSIASLVPNQGLLHRGLAFDSIDEWQRMLRYGFKIWKFQTWADEMKEKNLFGDVNFPCAIDGVKLESTIYKFVSDYLDVHYEDGVLDRDLELFWSRMMELFSRHLNDPKTQMPPTEFNLKNVKLVLAECIFRVTGGHSQAGDAIASALDPSMVNLRIANFTDDDDRNFVAPFEASSIQCAVTALTALPIAKLNTDVSHFYNDNKRAQNVYRTFLLDLAQLSLDIKRDNTWRIWPLSDYDPTCCNISTAV